MRLVIVVECPDAAARLGIPPMTAIPAHMARGTFPVGDMLSDASRLNAAMAYVSAGGNLAKFKPFEEVRGNIAKNVSAGIAKVAKAR